LKKEEKRIKEYRNDIKNSNIFLEVSKGCAFTCSLEISRLIEKIEEFENEQ